MNLLEHSVSDKQFRAWSKILVFPYAPFFLTHKLEKGITLSRSAFNQTFRDLNFHDSYTTYNVSQKASSVTLLSSQDLHNLPANKRLKLLRLQASLGRGQIYNFKEYKHLLKPSELELAQTCTFGFQNKEMLELNHDLWHTFSFETQKRWLAKFVSKDRSDCLSSSLSKKEWQSINQRYPAVKHLIGFTDRSGPNCFATTLAGLLEVINPASTSPQKTLRDLPPRLEVEEARKVSGLWLQTETFLHEIKKRGYKKSKRSVNADLPGDSILIWQNQYGIQHACLYIGNSLVLNKDAQSWFAPRQILKLESVLESWGEFKVCVYHKS